MKPGDRFPARTLRDARDGRDVALRAPPLGSVVLFLSHGSGCEPCNAFLEELKSADDAFRIWKGRLITVVPHPPGEVSDSAPPDAASPRFSLVADPKEELPGLLEMSGPALVIADRFGECFKTFDRPDMESDSHAFLPDMEDVEEWLTFLGTQCPECGVPDTAP